MYGEAGIYDRRSRKGSSKDMDELLLAKGVLDALMYKIRYDNASDILQMIRLGYTPAELAQELQVDIEAVRNGMRTANMSQVSQDANETSEIGATAMDWDDVRDAQQPSASDASTKSLEEADTMTAQRSSETPASHTQFVGHISQLLSND